VTPERAYSASVPPVRRLRVLRASLSIRSGWTLYNRNSTEEGCKVYFPARLQCIGPGVTELRSTHDEDNDLRVADLRPMNPLSFSNLGGSRLAEDFSEVRESLLRGPHFTQAWPTLARQARYDDAARPTSFDALSRSTRRAAVQHARRRYFHPGGFPSRTESKPRVRFQIGLKAEYVRHSKPRVTGS